MTVQELMNRLALQPPDKHVGLYDKDGDPDEVVDIDSYDDAVVLIGEFTSRPGGVE